MKYLYLTMAILNIVVLGTYLMDTSRVEVYQWIMTPFFAAYFTLSYMEERKSK